MILGVNFTQIRAILYLHFLKARIDLIFAGILLLVLSIILITDYSLTNLVEYIIVIIVNGYLINNYFINMTTSLVFDRLKKTRFCAP